MNSSESTDFPAAIADAVKASVAATFGSIFGQSPEIEPVADSPEPCRRVASVISFFGLQPWALTLIVPEATAIEMALKFTGFDVPFDSPDMGDVVGELTNVVAGEIVAQLSRRGVAAQMSLPTIARGNDVELLRGKEASTRQMRYDSLQGRFWLEVSTAPSVRRVCRTAGSAA